MDLYSRPIMCATSQKFVEKTFADGRKSTKFVKVFSLKVSRYTVHVDFNMNSIAVARAMSRPEEKLATEQIVRAMSWMIEHGWRL